MTTAFILKGYPRLSETFIAQEIRELERRGLRICIWSLRHPTDPYTHPVNQEIAAPVSYLPEFLHKERLRVTAGWRAARTLPGYDAARDRFLRDFARDTSRNRLRRFGQACVLAAELPPDVSHLHAHFLHTPASVTRYAALMRGLRWSVSAHARDIWTIPAWEKREKIDDASFTVTCSAYAHDHLQSLTGRSDDKLHLIYHGLDMARFPPPPDRVPADGDGKKAVRILSVGRAVPKKGFDVLLDALAQLPETLNWTFVHVGSGPLLGGLQKQTVHLGLSSRICWLERQPQDAVLRALRAADVFVLPSVIAPDGDRDGLPNVLLEAQSQRLACVASSVAAVPELIEDGRTGLLIPPGDSAMLADALVRMIRDPDLRVRLGRAGEIRVRSQFGMEVGIDRLAGLIRQQHATPLRETAA